MTSRKYGLPPQYPSLGRRGSNTPALPVMVPSSNSQMTQNRSRSLDGLLDSEPMLKGKDAPTVVLTPSSIPVSTEIIPSECVTQLETSDLPVKSLESNEFSAEKPSSINGTATDHCAVEPDVSTCTNSGSLNRGSSNNKQQNCEQNLELSDETACDINKASMLSLNSNSSDFKRKRNFMDKCVNKVRSLMKK
ncbi:hypothetical protein MML48_5g00016717 [Holotrichia oblita]|uniref:Uncharacterized protein n=2 Tax=Holotrichia oblita TaxID=644536 RepID=A0ACB9T407_HOLOL|nr:hypothetical protein MML48_5g00002771 [Holotrichia oblita]KAI4461551.1 hypothetical protein MML48_5g00016717 [Holotrichia oblita]